jgi:hypothetical protein
VTFRKGIQLFGLSLSLSEAGWCQKGNMHTTSSSPYLTYIPIRGRSARDGMRHSLIRSGLGLLEAAELRGTRGKILPRPASSRTRPGSLWGGAQRIRICDSTSGKQDNPSATCLGAAGGLPSTMKDPGSILLRSACGTGIPYRLAFFFVSSCPPFFPQNASHPTPSCFVTCL